MKTAAFELVAFVVGFQLVIASAALAGCFFTRDERCNGDSATEILTAIGVQAFALYAAEK